MTIQEITELIHFAKEQGIPSLKVDGLEFTIPPRDPTTLEIEGLKREILELKAITQRLELAVKMPEKKPNGMTPFSNRIRANG